MTEKKGRQAIPTALAARVLFRADRTCCVCRVRGKPVQIHHIDENPANTDIKNLSVLCFDCHRETQLRGGFDRKLDPDQVVLYRDDWNRLVALKRASEELAPKNQQEESVAVEYATSLAEIYQENKNYELLATHYDIIGNEELRDKYIELALKGAVGDDTVIYFRSLQGKPELVPKEVAERELNRRAKERDWLQRARTLEHLGRHREAVKDYLKGIERALEKERIFTAACYLKELCESGLIDELFVQALKQAEEDKDLWWQVRALQELGWESELDELLRQNEKGIRESGDLYFLSLLARTLGEDQAWLSIQKEIARQESSLYENNPKTD
jgi:hypothetical protein